MPETTRNSDSTSAAVEPSPNTASPVGTSCVNTVELGGKLVDPVLAGELAIGNAPQPTPGV